MVVRHRRRNQNACKHSAAGTDTAERLIWGQVFGTDLSRRVPMTCLLSKESLVAVACHEDLLRAREGVKAPQTAPRFGHVPSSGVRG